MTYSLTDYHAKYFAHELTKRCSSDSLEKLASVLIDAQVDLNPHQIDAALFAFKSPLSRGAILADEVGLGKTIEAGLVISQQWAEDMKNSLEIELKEIGKEIKLKQSEARKFPDLNQKIEAQNNVDARKEDLIGSVEARLKQMVNEELLFSIRWRLG